MVSTIEPLYARRADTDPLSGRAAGAWTIVQPIDSPDPEAANRQALADLEGGASGLALRLAGAPAAGAYGLPPDVASIREALAGIDLGAIHIRVDPHPQGIDIAGMLRDAIAESGLAPERADAAFGLDPIGPAAFLGESVPTPEAYAACFRDLMAARLKGPFADLDGRVFHEAGATEAQELAAILASAAWWLRALDDEAALPFLGATITVDRDQFLSIAKLRALRLLWARFAELSAGTTPPLRIHAETSRRMMTRADPQGNLAAHDDCSLRRSGRRG